jgi:hypothetical protein
LELNRALIGVSGQIGTYLHSQIGTCHGQFATSIKNNLVIIKYLYKNKKKAYTQAIVIILRKCRKAQA